MKMDRKLKIHFGSKFPLQTGKILGVNGKKQKFLSAELLKVA